MNNFLVISIPAICGLIPCLVCLKYFIRGKIWFDLLIGIIGWLLLFYGAVLGEIIIHKFNPSYHEGIGNSMVETLTPGLLILMLASLLFYPFLWFRVRKSKSAIVKNQGFLC